MSWKHYNEIIDIPVKRSQRQILINALLASGSSEAPHSIEILGLPGYLFSDSPDYQNGRIVVKTGSMVENPVSIEFNYKFDDESLIIENLQMWGALDFKHIVSSFKSLINSILSGEYTVEDIQAEAYSSETARRIDMLFFSDYKINKNFYAISKSFFQDTFGDFHIYMSKNHPGWDLFYWQCKENDISSFHSALYNNIKMTSELTKSGVKECCLISGFSEISIENQIDYVKFIKSAFSIGFKGRPSIKPFREEYISSFGFKNIVFLFIVNDEENHVDKINNFLLKHFCS